MYCFHERIIISVQFLFDKISHKQLKIVEFSGHKITTLKCDGILIVFGSKMNKFVFIIATATWFSILQPACSQKKKDFVCVQMDDCQCMFQSGKGINLNRLSVNKTDVEFPIKDIEIIFHPCSNIAVPKERIANVTVTSDCDSGTSLCVGHFINNDHFDMISLGTADSFEFQTSSDGSEISYVSNYNSWVTEIHLQCSVKPVNDLIVSRIDFDARIAIFVLTSPKSCQTYEFDSVKLGTWTVIFIVVCSIALIYFVGGAYLNKFLFGAQGYEMIPHYSFWRGLPSRIENCCSSCFSLYRPASGYDRI